MSRIALMISADIEPGAEGRRRDAQLFDVQLSLMTDAFAAEGLQLAPIVWACEPIKAADYSAVLALNAWDYQDRAEAFLSTLDGLEAAGATVFNPPALVRWNIRKTYLRDLEARGVAIVPTLWPEQPTGADVEAAFKTFGCDDVVVKRQIGGGARGQTRHKRGEALPAGPLLDRPGMIQPFLSAIAEEGEYSFLFVDNQFSHALVKRPAPGDYRIQEYYGGRSMAVEPEAADLATARAVLAALDAPPLYARVDMVRGAGGKLALMELEVIEPYLFPAQGPDGGRKLAATFAGALKKRLR